MGPAFAEATAGKLMGQTPMPRSSGNPFHNGTFTALARLLTPRRLKTSPACRALSCGLGGRSIQGQLVYTDLAFPTGLRRGG